jgi:3-phenylpropionate/cinnamic acid dioxygenase small subunit
VSLPCPSKERPVSARAAILDLLNRYAYTIDSGDLDGFAELFAHGAWVMEGGVAEHGKEALLAGTANIRLYPDGTPRTRHTTSNVELDIDEAAGTARGQCYVTVYQGTDEFPLQPIFAGHYFDDFVRIDGHWHFKQRLIRRQFVGNMRAHVRSPRKLLGDEPAGQPSASPPASA